MRMNEIGHMRRALSARLLQAGRQWRKTAEQAMAGHNVSEAMAMPLIWIGRLGGGVRQITVAAHVGVEGASLVRVLDQLQAQKLIERRDDPVDRRAKTLWLTPAGEALATEIETMLDELRDRVLGEVSQADIEAANRVLQAFDKAEARILPLPVAKGVA